MSFFSWVLNKCRRVDYNMNGMHPSEASDLSESYPFLDEILRMVESGEVIELGHPLYETYLLARQRGLVQRIGKEGEKVVPSPRAEEYRELRPKR